MENQEKISVLGRIERGCVSSLVKAECKSEISSKEVDKILNVYIEPTIINKGIENGKCQYKGKINFFVCYIDTENQIRRAELSTDYEGEIEIPYNNSKVILSVKGEKAESDLSNIKLILTGHVKVTARIIEISKTDCFTGGKDIITKTSEIESVKSVELNGNFSVEEEFELPYMIREVLSQKAETVINTVTAGVASVLVEGEVIVSVISLSSGEKSDIVREERTIPFKAELECEDSMPNSNAWVLAYTKSFKTDFISDEDKNISNFTASVVIGFNGEATVKENLQVTSDAFSINNDVRLESVEIVREENILEESKKVSIDEKVGVDGIDGDTKVLAVINDSVEIVSVNEKKRKTEVTGAINLSVILKDGDGRPFVRKIEVPITTEAEGKVNILSASASGLTAEKAESGIVVKGQIVLTYTTTVCYNDRAVTDVIIDGEKKVNTSAISVYMAYSGEEVWDISKRIGISPNDLINANKDLSFPLGKDERIVVYRQL